MEIHKREYLVARIIAGVVRLKIRANLVLDVKSLTPEQNYEAQELYQEVFDEAFFNGVSIQTEVLEMLIDQGLWSPFEEGLIERVNKDIEDFKVELYKSGFNANKQKSCRKLLSKAKDKLLELHQKKHAYDFISCEGVSSYSRWCWIIENCTFYQKKPYDFSEHSISQTLSDYQNAMLGESEIRELARSEPWKSIWSSSKNEGVLFGKRAIELSEEQKHLIMWSTMYDSIGESPDSPSDKIIADDDMLDGWLILQRREREHNKKEQLMSDTLSNQKIANADEIFVMANSREDIEKIHSMNDLEGSVIKKERWNKVEQEGEVKHQQFDDIKRGLMKDQIEAVKNQAR